MAKGLEVENPVTADCKGVRQGPERDEPMPLCCEEKSVEAAENKRVAECSLRKRVCKRFNEGACLVGLSKHVKNRDLGIDQDDEGRAFGGRGALAGNSQTIIARKEYQINIYLYS